MPLWKSVDIINSCSVNPGIHSFWIDSWVLFLGRCLKKGFWCFWRELVSGIWFSWDMIFYEIVNISINWLITNVRQRFCFRLLILLSIESCMCFADWSIKNANLFRYWFSCLSFFCWFCCFSGSLYLFLWKRLSFFCGNFCFFCCLFSCFCLSLFSCLRLNLFNCFVVFLLKFCNLFYFWFQ